MLLKIPLVIFFLISSLAFTSSAQESQGDTLLANKLLKKAMDYYYQVNYDSALIYFRASSDRDIVTKNWEGYIHCLNLMGDTYSRKLILDSMEITLRCARVSESQWLEEDNLECALTYSLMGLLHIYREEFDSAISEIEKGKEIRENKLGKDHRFVVTS
jgi:tetratricopeptide (TPR) repeat protein